MEIRKVSIDLINPAPYNPRRDLQPGDAEYEKLQRSIEEFGYVEPLVWNQRTGNLVGGHQRFKVLVAGGATELDVSVVDLDDTREKALNLALNKISGDWDDEALAAVLEELSAAGVADLSGFDPHEIDGLLKLFDAGSEETAGDFDNNEISLGSFEEDKFDHECPRCGFVFNDKPGSDD